MSTTATILVSGSTLQPTTSAASCRVMDINDDKDYGCASTLSETGGGPLIDFVLA